MYIKLDNNRNKTPLMKRNDKGIQIYLGRIIRVGRSVSPMVIDTTNTIPTSISRRSKELKIKRSKVQRQLR